jgi:hypothetical protein
VKKIKAAVTLHKMGLGKSTDQGGTVNNFFKLKSQKVSKFREDEDL